MVLKKLPAATDQDSFTTWTWLKDLQAWLKGMFYPSTSSTSSFTAGANYFYPVDATSASVVVTLPKASDSIGKKYLIKRTDATVANLVTITANAADLIDGLVSQILNYKYASLEILSDGVSNWQITKGIALRGDYSNGIPTLNFMQTSKVDDNTFISLLPNGTGSQTGYRIYDTSDLTSAAGHFAEYRNTGAGIVINSRRLGTTAPALPIVLQITTIDGLRIDQPVVNLGVNVVVGSAALATTATDGFMYLGTCAGPPTGVPTAYTGRTPVILDSTNDIWYYYNGSWKQFGAPVPKFITVTTVGNGTTAAAPAGTTACEIILQAGGGIGGNGSATSGGGGGGGGEYMRRTIPVTAGNTYNYNVGVAGGNTTFTGDTTVWTTLNGAAGATGAGGGTGGAGGGRLGPAGGARATPGGPGLAAVVEGIDAISGASGGGSGTPSVNTPGGTGGPCEENGGAAGGAGAATPLPGGGAGASSRFGKGPVGGAAANNGVAAPTAAYGVGGSGAGAGAGTTGAPGQQGVLMYRWV